MLRDGLKNSIKKYRAEMRELTKSILDIALARQKVAELIARAKESSGARIENQEVEKRLAAEMASYAKKIGVDGDLGRRVVAELIEYSKIAQRKKIFLGPIKKYLEYTGIRTVSIYGAGRMGGWFASYFSEAGLSVTAYDENRRLASKWERETGIRFAKSFDQATSADLHIVAVPIRETPKLVRKLAKIKASQVRILEISSVKNGVRKLLAQGSLPESVWLCSIHPLFGSGANPFGENCIIEIGKKSEFASHVFPHYRIFKMSVDEHDRLMAFVLTLPHLHALTFADIVGGGKIPANIHSPSFDHMLELSKRVLSENERIYYEIQATNPYARDAISLTARSVAKLQRLVRDESSFERFFRQTRRELV